MQYYDRHEIKPDSWTLTKYLNLYFEVVRYNRRTTCFERLDYDVDTLILKLGGKGLDAKRKAAAYCMGKTVEELIRRYNIEIRDWVTVSDDFGDGLAEYIRQTTYTERGTKNNGVVRKAYSIPKLVLDRMIRHYRNIKEIDPFADWLESLPPKKPEPDSKCFQWINDVFDACKGFDMNNAQLAKWSSIYMVLNAITRTFEPGAMTHSLPTLCGKKGMGKSSIFKFLLPEEFRLFGFQGRLKIGLEEKQLVKKSL